MPRSLFRLLKTRHAPRASGSERRRRAADYYERARTALPLDLLTAVAPQSSPGSVAIVGAGFAGCMAAFVASRLGFDVTVYEASQQPGGRVRSSEELVSGRILEMGAELIGLNHPVWLACAQQAGFGLAVVTPEDEQGGGLLESPLILDGQSYDSAAQQQLYNGMQTVLDAWIDQSVSVNCWQPWDSPNAGELDNQTLQDQIPANTPADVALAIATEFELNNTVRIDQQSWLANLAQINAGGGEGFFDDTEIFRCAAGNQRLAPWLLAGLTPVSKVADAIQTTDQVLVHFTDGSEDGPFDYVIVATSVAVWPTIAVDGKPFPYTAIQSGPAIKYLAAVENRFWIPDGLSPSGMSDSLGMTWEGTDNQADTARFDLTVFAGGHAAQNAIKSGGSDGYFAPLIQQLYPTFATNGPTCFVDFPNEAAIRTGYSCPAPGQVVGAQREYTTPYRDCLFVAGEHTSPAWFGFMEGALESGLIAAARLGEAAGVLESPAID